MSRIEKRFEELKQQGRKGLVTFIMACDPDLATCETILKACPKAVPISLNSVCRSAILWLMVLLYRKLQFAP